MNTRAFLALALASFTLPQTLLAQGSLTSPGAPAATMKTLDQLDAKLEKRTAISSAPTTISTSGSYYLAGNLAVTTGDAITISVDNITLDLNGFTISSTASPASGTAVNINGLRRNVTVKNGHIRGTTTFAAGTFTTGGFLNGIENSTLLSANLRVADVSVSSAGEDGISFVLSTPSSRNVIERCIVGVCGGNGVKAGSVSACHVETAGGSGVIGDIVSNSFGESVGLAGGNHGINGFSVVENCRGVASAGIGIAAGSAQVSNSFGTSDSNVGLAALGATNCHGLSTSNSGLVAPNAHHCYGETTSGTNGISGTIISFCRGRRDGGVAIVCFNAIGCAVNGTGTVSATNKSLGTP